MPLCRTCHTLSCPSSVSTASRPPAGLKETVDGTAAPERAARMRSQRRRAGAGGGTAGGAVDAVQKMREAYGGLLQACEQHTGQTVGE
eukprot:5480725-Prymnesium_polylepis.1